MATNPADAIVDRLITRALPGFDAIGVELVEKIRDAIDVPVEFTSGAVIRSEPGEPPRRESGDYQGSIRHVTERDGDTITTVVGTDSVIGAYLEGGTERMKPRPHFAPVTDEFAQNAVERVQQAFSQTQE